eukprot:c6628_g1_i1.p1 GENE.c6628_g1_i1~~c6628_g1_i1.p1  ORF type:complete len:265 (-),score=90.36 c6628_g1_i1:216-983(-)
MEKYIQIQETTVPEEEVFGLDDEGPRRYSMMEQPPKLNRRFTPSMILRSSENASQNSSGGALQLRKSRSSANLVRRTGEGFVPPPPPAEEDFDDSVDLRRNTVAYMMSEAQADEVIMARERDKLMQRHKDEVEKLSSALESEKLRQQAKIQAEIRMKQEMNELLELRVKVEQYRGQRDEALLSLKALRADLESRDRDLAALKQTAKLPLIDSTLQQQQVQVLRQQRDESNANLRALRAQFEEQTNELNRLRAING